MLYKGDPFTNKTITILAALLGNHARCTLRNMIRSAVFFLTIACVFPLLAQPPSSGKLITLNLAATNSRDEPVTDLQTSDLQLREDGKSQPVVFFHFAGSNRTLAAHAPGEFDNHAAAAPVVILFDRWNERLVLSGRSGIELGTAIQHLETAGNIYIYFLTNKGELAPVHPLPGTDGDVRAADPSPAELRDELEHGIQEYQGFRARDDTNVRLQKTFDALNMLRLRMGTLAGRKSLIWVTQGLPLVFRGAGNAIVDLTPDVRKMSELMAQSQIAIYTVDQTNGVGSELSRTLQLFSALTGGRWSSRDNPALALSDALTDARGSYRIAYYSTAAEKEGKEIRIHVDTARKGVHLLTREGFTVEGPGPSPEQQEAARFDNQIRSPIEASEIGLRVAISRKPQTDSVHFDIHADPADVLVQPDGDHYRAELDVITALYDGNTVKVTAPATRVDLTLTKAQLDQAASAGISLPLDVSVGNQVQKVRVIVLDPKLQALGSVTIPTK
jgi:VWFA-related protein